MSYAPAERILNAGIVVVALCAVALTSLVAYRRLRPPAPPSSAPPIVAVADWQRFASTGHRFGSTSAPVTIVEFSDFQCPYCRAIEPLLKQTLLKYGGRVALIYRHFPLSQIHPLAYSAAIAAECAGSQGRFNAYHDSLFAGDSLGDRAWTTIAGRAGVSDTLQFEPCLSDSLPTRAIKRDVAAGDQLGIIGTPTLLINQDRVTGGADPGVIDSVVQLALAHKPSHG
jgi:protein-disulfide isomerase